MLDVSIEGAPRLAGLRFSGIGDHADCAEIARVMNESWKADSVVWGVSEDEVRDSIENPVGSNPHKDMLLVYLHDRLVGVANTSRDRAPDGSRILRHLVHLAPEARVPGLRRAVLSWAERHLADSLVGEVPAAHAEYMAWAASSPNDWKALLENAGYAPRRYLFEMRRNASDPLPETHLPDGIEIRPVSPDEYRQLWEASGEALKDDIDFSEQYQSEEAFRRWLTDSSNRLALWTVAWDGSEIVGGVGMQIKDYENRRTGRKRAWTDPVFVRRPWRHRGIAHSLIASAVQTAIEQGMEECALDVNTDNPSGAVRLYESMGYRRLYELVFYAKPVPKI